MRASRITIGYVAPSAPAEAGVDLVIAVPAGALSTTGQAPATAVGLSVAPAQDALAVTGQAPTIVTTANHFIDVPAGALTATGTVSMVMSVETVQPAQYAAQITGYLPTATTTANHIRAPPVGTLAVTGLAPAIPADAKLAEPAAGTITLVPAAPTADQTFNIFVIDVDTDETVYDGQTGVIVTVTGEVAASGKRVFIEQGGNFVEQPVTAEDASTATITVDFASVLVIGAATLHVWSPI